MKKLLILTVVATALTFASCRKDRTCSCTSTVDGPGGITTTQLPDTTLTDVTLGEMKDFCNEKNDTYMAGLETITISCTYQ